MSFNKVAIARKNTAGWSRIFGSARSMSNSRLLGSALSWVLGISAFYCSLFYVPAFFDYKKVFGISNVTPNIDDKKHSVLSPYMELMQLNRTYLKSGQSMEAYYKIIGNNPAELLLYTCMSPAVIEVFVCDPAIVKRIPLEKARGSYSVQVPENGFYGYRVQVAERSDKYYLIWRRRF